MIYKTEQVLSQGHDKYFLYRQGVLVIEGCIKIGPVCKNSSFLNQQFLSNYNASLRCHTTQLTHS